MKNVARPEVDGRPSHLFLNRTPRFGSDRPTAKVPQPIPEIGIVLVDDYRAFQQLL